MTTACSACVMPICVPGQIADLALPNCRRPARARPSNRRFGPPGRVQHEWLVGARVRGVSEAVAGLHERLTRTRAVMEPFSGAVRPREAGCR
jgi:hypothetical protein